MAGPRAQPKSENTKQGAAWWFAGYAGGSLLGAHPNLIADRWIYILERQEAVPVKLHLEVRADQDGKLTQVAGDLRRFQERGSPRLKMAPVDSVPLPLYLNSKPVRYFLFASPTRLTKRAVAALEFAMAPPSDEWIDLEQPLPGRAYFHNGRPPVLVVVFRKSSPDGLTINVGLKRKR